MGRLTKNVGNLVLLVGILCFLLLGTHVQAQNSLEQKGGDALLWTSEALLAVDLFQTQYILKHERHYKELNPILRSLGPNYAPLSFAFWMIATPLIGEYLIPEYRIYWYGYMTLAEGIVVTNNLSIGVGFSF